MIDENSTLEDVCFAVADALERASATAVLTGGSAATLYAPDFYTSLDADFVFRRPLSAKELAHILEPLGYRPAPTRGMFEHGKSHFTLDFPKGPLAVGGDYVRSTATLRRGELELHILTPTDCVKDRLAHFIFWNDATALNAAVAVAKSTHGREINYDDIEDWVRKESSAGIDYHPKLLEFLERAGINRAARPETSTLGLRFLTAPLAGMHPMLSSDRFGPSSFSYVRLSATSPGNMTVLTKSVQDEIVAIVLPTLGTDLEPETKADGILFTAKPPPPSDLAEPPAQWAARCFIRRDEQIEIRQPELMGRPELDQIVDTLAAGFSIAARAFKLLGTGSVVSGTLAYKFAPAENLQLASDADIPFEIDFAQARFSEIAAQLLLYLQRHGGRAGELSDFDALLERTWANHAHDFPDGDTRTLWSPTGMR